jgi:hypothetical protein
VDKMGYSNLYLIGIIKKLYDSLPPDIDQQSYLDKKNKIRMFMINIRYIRRDEQKKTFQQIVIEEYNRINLDSIGEEFTLIKVLDIFGLLV